MAYKAPVLKQKFFDENGDPLSGGKLYSYVAGTTTPTATYTDKAATVPNTNPIILDSEGECELWLVQGSYKFVLHNSLDVEQWTQDLIEIVDENSVGEVTLLTVADSPYFVSNSDSGKLLSVDASGGNVVLLMNSISSFLSGFSFNVTIKKSDSSTNTVYIGRSDTDTIDGGASKTLRNKNDSISFIPDTNSSPKNWVSYSSMPDKLALSLGTAALPSYSFEGDSNTGVYSPAADKVGVVAGGEEILRVENDGSISFMKEVASTPATPSTGVKKIYHKDDGKLYTLNDAGAETELGSGGGSGGINYIDNPDAEAGSNGVTVTSNITKALETANPIRGKQSFKFTIASTATTADYIEFDLKDIDGLGQNIDNFDKGKSNHISFDYRTDSNYTTDDLQVVVRNTDANSGSGEDELVRGGTESGKLGATSTNDNRFTGVVYFNSTDNSYKLRLNVVSAPSSASEIIIDNISMGPDKIMDMPIQGYMGSYVPTITTGTGTVTNYTAICHYWRDDDKVTVRGRLEFTGAAGTWGTNLNFSQPPGTTRDLSKALAAEAMGTAVIGDFGSGWNDAFPFVNGTTISILAKGSAGSYVGASFLSSTVPITFTTNDSINFQVTYPVTEWANSSALLSTQERLNQNVDIAGAGNAATVLTANVTDIDFTEITDTNGSWNGSKFIAPYNGKFTVVGCAFLSGSAVIEINSFIDGSADKLCGHNGGDSSTIHTFMWQGRLQKDQELSFRSDAGVTLSNDTNNHWIDISGIPDLTVIGAPSGVLKTQTKVLSSDVLNTSTISDFTFNNLTIGMSYIISGCFSVSGLATAQTNITMDVNHDGSIIKKLVLSREATNESYSVGLYIPFIATATSLTFDATIPTAFNYVAGNGTREESFITVSECNPMIETNEW